MKVKRYVHVHATPFSLAMANNSAIFLDTNCEEIGILF